MNILFLDQYSDLGGGQRCLLDLLPAVRARGWRAHLAAPGNGRLCEEAARLDATVDEIACGPYRAGRKSMRDILRFAREAGPLRARIRELAERYRADLVYVNGPRVLPAAAGAVRDRPLLFHCHSSLGWPHRWMVERCLEGVTVVGSCRFVLDSFRRRTEMHVVYNGVAGGPRKAGRRGRRVGVIGRIAPGKGQAEFLAAARLVPGSQFVICGEPLFSDARSRAYSARLRVLARGLPVEFLGWRDDVAAVLGELDVLVAPSVAPEATTRVILEAYAAGVPVVAAKVGGIPEVVEDGVTGFLVDARRPAELAARIREVLEMPGERLQAVIERARQEWQRRFTLTRYQEEMMQRMELAAGISCAPRLSTTGC